MKRSSSATLTLIGALPFFMTACGSDMVDSRSASPGPIVYDSVETCVADGNGTGECALAERDARDNSPRFATSAECESQFEGCHRVASAGARENGGGGWFMPAMVGYMLGRSTSPGVAPDSSSLYRNRGGSLTELSRVSGGGSVMRPASVASVATRSTLSQHRAPARAGRAPRGGFGRSSRGYGG